MSFIRKLFRNSEFNDDDEFVEAARNRSNRAAVELFRRTIKHLRVIMLEDDSSAFDWIEIDDVVHEGLRILYQKLDNDEYIPRPNVRFHSYFIGICKNAWRNMKSKKYNQNELLIPHSETIFTDGLVKPFLQELVDDQSSKLHELLAKIKEECRDLLTRFYFYHQKFDEIETVMGIQPNTGRQRKARCIQKLQKEFLG